MENNDYIGRKFNNWIYEKFLLYGDKYVGQWWKDRGLKNFMEWAREKGIDYMNVEES